MSWILLWYTVFEENVYFVLAAQTRDDIRERKIKDILNKQEFKDIVNFGYSKKIIRRAAEEVFKDIGNFSYCTLSIRIKLG